MSVARHTLVRTERIGDASVQPRQLNELLQHGTMVAITVTGRYVSFPTAYGGTPEVAVGLLGSVEYRVTRVRRGSFAISRVAAGTSRGMYVSLGPRA